MDSGGQCDESPISILLVVFISAQSNYIQCSSLRRDKEESKRETRSKIPVGDAISPPSPENMGFHQA
jgi:hypothetical protein